MLSTSARLLRLLSLLQARRFWAGAELAERLEVTDRTLRRDVDRLRLLGYPVDATAGVAGGYQLAAGAALPPLLLADDEAQAVAIALSAATVGGVSGIEDAGLRALVKLEQVLPQRLKSKVNVMRTAVVPLARTQVQVDAQLLATLAAAVRDHVSVEFDYLDGKGRSTERAAEPHAVVHTGYRWYLVAWDKQREDFRTFRVDRVRGVPRLAARFSPRPLPDGGDVKSYVSRSLSTAAYEFRARVLLHAPKSEVAKHVSAAAGVVEEVDATHCILVAGAPSPQTFAWWLLMIGVDFEVLEPAELTQHLAVLHARLGRTLQAGAKGAQPKKARAQRPKPS